MRRTTLPWLLALLAVGSVTAAPQSRAADAGEPTAGAPQASPVESSLPGLQTALQEQRFADVEAEAKSLAAQCAAQPACADSESAIVIQLALSQALLGLERPADAVAPLTIVETALRTRMPDQVTPIAQIGTQRAQALYAAGRYPEALEELRSLEDIYRQAYGEASEMQAMLANETGGALDALGRFDEAAPYYEKTLAIVARTRGADSADAGAALNNIARNLSNRGRTNEAIAKYREALAIKIHRLGEDSPEAAATYNNLGSCLTRVGRYDEAEAMLLKALQVRRDRQGEDAPETATAYANLAGALDLQGRNAEAEAMYRKALQIRRQRLGDDHPDTAQVELALAQSIKHQGRDGEAEPFFERALATYRTRLGADHPSTIACAMAYADALWTQGKFEDALAMTQTAFDAERRDMGADDPRLAESYTQLGLMLWKMRQYPEAQGVMERAIHLSSQAGASPQNMAILFGGLGQVQLKNGKPDAAIVSLRRAAGLLRSEQAAGAPLPTRDDARLRDSVSLASIFAVLADALWADSAHRKDPGILEEALAALQDASTTSAGAAVAQMGARFTGGDSRLRALARKRQDLALAWSANNREFMRELASREPGAKERADALRIESQRIATDLQGTDRELRESFPAYYDLVNPAPLTLAQMRALLKDDEALLIVVPTVNGTHSLAVSRSAVDWARSEWDIDRARDAVSRLRCDLDPTRCRLPADASAGTTRGAERTDAAKPHRKAGAFDRRTAYALYEQIVAPVMPVLANARNVYVVAHGPLSALPFSVLLTTPPGEGEDDSNPDVLRQSPWLIRRFALTGLPSVASLKSLRAFEPTTATTSRLDFVGFGDPVFAGDPATARGATRAAGLFRGVGSNGAGLADPDAMRRAFPPLPGTRVELEAMRAAFAPRSEVYLGPQATESTVKQTSFEGVRVIAFSTHGLVAGEMEGLAEPGLVLTPPVTASVQDDGLLTATEVAQFHLSADWVILSACNTAASDGTPDADALSGLARAFFYAGARSLLVSHWPVRDDVASTLTVDAIRRERTHPELSRAEALRQATLAIIDGAEGSTAQARSLSHPAAWAPFSLVGDGR